MVASAVASAFGIARVTPLLLGWQILRMGMSHLAADEAPATTPVGPSLKLSAVLTKCVADIAERQDLLVRCAIGAGRGAPGCFVPALAAVELNGANHLGADPRMCDPSRPSDRDRYPALWGVLVHEATHANEGEG